MQKKMIMPRSVKCSICKSQKTRFVAEVHSSPVSMRTQLWNCHDCGIHFLDPKPDLVKETDFYRWEYFSRGTLSEWYDQRMPVFREGIKAIEKLTTERNLFDVGCGAGFFLQFAQSRGWQVSGNELSEDAIRFAEKEFGLTLCRGGVETLSKSENAYSAVTLWNVLDQMYDPKSEMQHIAKLLKPGGVLALRVSNLDFHLWLHQVWNLFFKTHKAEPTVFHLVMFNAKSIKFFLKSLGFSDVRISNSLLDRKSPALVAVFGSCIAHWVGCFVFGFVELLRWLSLGKCCLSPSLFITAKKGN